MKRRILVGTAVFCTLLAGSILAQPPASTATCIISATVSEIMEWAADFTALDVGTMTHQTDVLTGSSTQTLYTNGHVTITADNGTDAELSEVGGDTLYTEYGLLYDHDGLTETGGANVPYAVYSSFIDTGSAVTHVAGDGAVDVTLQVRASNAGSTQADYGSYGATQTLTATWSS